MAGIEQGEKKLKKRASLREFLFRYPDFPEGEVIQDDESQPGHPDFVVGEMGIELVDFIRGQAFGTMGQQGGAIVRAQENIFDTIVRNAQQKFEAEYNR